MGTALLVRRRRGVEPTPAGETLLEHARAMLASAERIERDMAAYASGVRGQVRVVATSSAIAESLPDDIAAFLADPAHGDIRVDIEERVSTQVLQAVREGSASLGICWDAADLSGLQTRRYRVDHLAVVTHASHPLGQRARLSVDDILSFELVGLPPSSAVEVMLQREAALRGKSLNHRVVAATFEAALRVVRAGLALCVLPAELVQGYATAFDLRVIPLAEPWARREFALSFRSEDTLSAAARLLLDHLVVSATASAPRHALDAVGDRNSSQIGLKSMSSLRN